MVLFYMKMIVSAMFLENLFFFMCRALGIDFQCLMVYSFSIEFMLKRLDPHVCFIWSDIKRKRSAVMPRSFVEVSSNVFLNLENLVSIVKSKDADPPSFFLQCLRSPRDNTSNGWYLVTKENQPDAYKIIESWMKRNVIPPRPTAD